jgi:lipocalin-like protein
MPTRVTSIAALVLAAVALQGTAGFAVAQKTKSQAELRKTFIGTWRLISIEGGTTRANRGTKPTGLIYYDGNGYMAAQIMPDRPRPTWTGAPTPEVAVEAIRGYTAYFGTYTIDEKAATVTHHRQGMLDGGTVDFVRRYEFAPGDRIILTPVGNTATPTHLTWERIK